MKKSFKLLVCKVLVIVLLLIQALPVLACTPNIPDPIFLGSKLIQIIRFASLDKSLLDLTSASFSVYKDNVPIAPSSTSTKSWDEIAPGGVGYIRTYKFERDLAEDRFAGTYTTVAQAVYNGAYSTPLEHNNYIAAKIIREDASSYYGLKDQPYSVKFKTNLEGTITWSVYKPNLPEGLDCRIGTDPTETVANSVYMEIYGTPTKVGNYRFEIGVTNGKLTKKDKYSIPVYLTAPKSDHKPGSPSTPHIIVYYYVETKQMVTYWIGDTKVSKLPEKECKKIQESVEKGRPIHLDVGDGTPSQSFETTGDFIKFIRINSSSLFLNYGNVKCEVPSNALDIDHLAAELKVTSVKDIKININVDEVSDPLNFKFKLVSKAFKIKITASGPNGKTIEITKTKTRIKCYLPFNKNIAKPILHGTRNVYRIIGHKLQFCSSVFDGMNYVFETTECGVFAVLDLQITFRDVSRHHWAYTSIQIVASRSVFFNVYDALTVEDAADGSQEGTLRFNTGTYLPDSSISGRTFVEGLLQTLQLDQVSDDSNLPAQKQMLETAVKLGICDSQFLTRADVSITREQMTLMAMNAYTHVSGKKITAEALSYTGRFNDLHAIAPVSAESIKAAHHAGIITGIDANTFNPGSQANKAEAAAILTRLLTVLEKL